MTALLALLTGLVVGWHERRHPSIASDLNTVGILTAIAGILGTIGSAIGGAATAAGETLGVIAPAVAEGTAAVAPAAAAGAGGTALPAALGGALGGVGTGTVLAPTAGVGAAEGLGLAGAGVGGPVGAGTVLAPGATGVAQGAQAPWQKYAKLATQLAGQSGGDDKQQPGAGQPQVPQLLRHEPLKLNLGFDHPSTLSQQLAQTLNARRMRLQQLLSGGGGNG